MDLESPKNELPKATSVRFVIFCETKFGESVYLIGNTSQLKNWQIKEAIELSSVNYSPENPIWETAESLLLPLNALIEYKFFKKLADGKPLWESLPGDVNRTLNLTSGESIEVEHNFGIASGQIVPSKNQEASGGVPRPPNIRLRKPTMAV